MIDTTIRFRLDKETPGTFRYLEVDHHGAAVAKDEIKVGYLYLRKRALQGQCPDQIVINISEP